MSINLVIFSHSDYSYLWNIIQDSIENIKELNPIFISNKTNLDKPTGFIKYIEYDETYCYAKRWINLLKYIESKYIIVVNDVNIILNYDVYKIKNLIQKNR